MPLQVPPCFPPMRTKDRRLWHTSPWPRTSGLPHNLGEAGRRCRPAFLFAKEGYHGRQGIREHRHWREGQSQSTGGTSRAHCRLRLADRMGWRAIRPNTPAPRKCLRLFAHENRKSCGEGKGGSVRVDIVGRRRIKKKKN